MYIYEHTHIDTHTHKRTGCQDRRMVWNFLRIPGYPKLLKWFILILLFKTETGWVLWTTVKCLIVW